MTKTPNANNAAARFARILNNTYEVASIAVVTRTKGTITLDSMHGAAHNRAMGLAGEFSVRPHVQHNGNVTTFCF